jgi:hypothetical protein
MSLAKSNSNERDSWREPIEVSRDSIAHLPTTFGSAMSEPLQSQSSHHVTEEPTEDQNDDMDATNLTPYSPGMNDSALNITVQTQSPSHCSI